MQEPRRYPEASVGQQSVRPERVRVVVEVTAGSNLRHTYDEHTLELRSVREVASRYPYPYGFVMDTVSEDGDAVDCFILTARPLAAGIPTEAEVIGLVEQFENGEVDHKILAGLPGDAVTLDPGRRRALRRFVRSLFDPYPWVHVRVGRILGADVAGAFLGNHRR
jgi:hypothetical protein